MKQRFTKIKNWIIDLWKKATPGGAAWKGASYAMAVSTVIITVVYAWFSLRPSGVIPFLVFILLAVLASLFGGKSGFIYCAVIAFLSGKFWGPYSSLQ